MTVHCPDCDQSVGLVGGSRCCLCGTTRDVPQKREGIPGYTVAGLLSVPLLGYAIYAVAAASPGEFLGWPGTVAFLAGAACFVYAVGAGAAAGAVRPSLVNALQLLSRVKQV